MELLNRGAGMSEESELFHQRVDALTMERDAARVAERAASESARGSGYGGYRREARPAHEAASVPAQKVPEPGYRSQTGTSLTISENNMRVLKFDGHKVHLWSGRFQTFLTGRGSINALESTSDPMRIAGSLGGMAEPDRLIYRSGEERVEHGVSGGSEPVEERMHATGFVNEEWKAVPGTGLVSIAECTARLLRGSAAI